MSIFHITCWQRNRCRWSVASDLAIRPSSIVVVVGSSATWPTAGKGAHAGMSGDMQLHCIGDDIVSPHITVPGGVGAARIVCGTYLTSVWHRDAYVRRKNDFSPCLSTAMMEGAAPPSRPITPA